MCVAVPDNPCPDAVVPLQVPVEGDAVLSEEVRNDEIWVTCLLAFEVIHSFMQKEGRMGGEEEVGGIYTEGDVFAEEDRGPPTVAMPESHKDLGTIKCYACGAAVWPKHGKLIGCFDVEKNVHVCAYCKSAGLAKGESIKDMIRDHSSDEEEVARKQEAATANIDLQRASAKEIVHLEWNEKTGGRDEGGGERGDEGEINEDDCLSWSELEPQVSPLVMRDPEREKRLDARVSYCEQTYWRCSHCGGLNSPSARCGTCRRFKDRKRTSETVLLERTRFELLNGREFWICTVCEIAMPSLRAPCGGCGKMISFVLLEIGEFEEFGRKQREKCKFLERPSALTTLIDVMEREAPNKSKE